MGGSGVDGAIHNAINQINGEENYFKNKIKEETDGSKKKKDDAIRCNYGNAVITEGYKLTNYVIHAVGPRWDGGEDTICSKSCIDKLKNCYNAIFEHMDKNSINSIAIPVISSGSYRFPYYLAAKIELVSVCNYLTRLQKSDPDRFEKIEEIFIVVFDKKDVAVFQSMLEKYSIHVNKGYRLLYLTTDESHHAYLNEVKEHDSQHNYFGTLKILRSFLIHFEWIFFIGYHLKGRFADKTWEGKRLFIEVEVLIKIFF